MLINSSNVSANSYSKSLEFEQSAKANIISLGMDDIAATLEKTGGSGKQLSELMRGPELSSPRKEISQPVLDELSSYLKNNIENPEFTDKLNSLYSKVAVSVDELVQIKLKEQQVEVGKPLDISGMSSPAVALLVAANVLMIALSTADTALSSKLSLVSFDAAKTTAASMVREGIDMLSGSISQTALQLGITGVGAKLEHKGLSNERGALKNNAAKMNKLSAESTSIKNSLNSQTAVKLGADDVDGLTQLNMKPQQNSITQKLSDSNLASTSAGNQTDSLSLNSSNKTLSAEHQTVLAKRLESIDADIRAEELALSNNRLKSRDQQVTGDTIMKSSMAVGSIAGGSGQYTATIERSEQQISQVNSRVANTASEDTRESSRKTNSLIQELLRVMDSINQSKNAALSTIAGNIRA